MKRNLFFIALLMVCFGTSSCDEDDLEAIIPAFNVKMVQTENIPVQIDQTNGVRATFSEKTTISIVNDDTKDHLAKIEKLTINKLRYKIINFSGDPNGDVEGSFEVAGEVSLSNAFVVKTSADQGTVYEVSETAELTRIANALKGGQNVTVEYGGNALCDEDDMNFTVEVTLDATVRINP